MLFDTAEPVIWHWLTPIYRHITELQPTDTVAFLCVSGTQLKAFCVNNVYFFMKKRQKVQCVSYEHTTQLLAIRSGTVKLRPKLPDFFLWLSLELLMLDLKLVQLQKNPR